MRLSVRDLTLGYGKKMVVRGASLEVGRREVVALVGHNGAGKSTLLHGIFGILQAVDGDVNWNGRSITNEAPSKKVLAGIAYAPQGAQVYRSLTIAENLHLGAYSLKDRHAVESNIGKAYELFPILYERRRSLAGSLSGGERQMLAIGAVLAIGPKLVLLDEPSGGLAPQVVEKVFDTVRRIVNDFDASVLLVEQNLKEAFRIADRAYIMAKGAITTDGTPAELEGSGRLQQHFFGGPKVEQPLQ